MEETVSISQPENSNAMDTSEPVKTENQESFVTPESKTEKKPEDEEKRTELNKSTLIAVLQFLKKHNLQETEAVLRKETKLTDDGKIPEAQNGSDVSSVLSTYKSEGDPDIYEETYVSLKKFIDTALDSYKHELSMILYPVFVHMYLELVYNEHEQQAWYFMEKFGPEQEHYYLDDVKKLSCLTKKDHMKGNEFMDNFRSGQFTVRMSRDTYNFLKRHLQDKKNNVLQNIIQEHLYLDVYEGISRTKQQIDNTAGALIGEAARQANKAKVYYGLPKEPEIQIPLDDDEETQEGDDKPKKKKPKKDPLLSKKARNDPNAPPANRIPLPELRDADKIDKINAMREALKRVRLGPNSLPSICFYTFLNSHQGVTSAEISEDSSLLSAGASDSVVRIWSLNANKLKAMKPASELEHVDKEADDVLYRMMDEKNATDMRALIGHSGPVYSSSFSPDRNLLLSCSEDSTVRLWSLQTWTNVVCYKGHCFPVWDVKFSPHGYYFASCGHDRTARLWATDCYQPVRIFSGHVSDVDCVQFHPNSNYIATGSSDRTIRLWDVSSGNCVRFMTGHKGTVYNLAFSTCGRFLASAEIYFGTLYHGHHQSMLAASSRDSKHRLMMAIIKCAKIYFCTEEIGTDKKILIWDIAYGHLLAELTGHTDTIYSLAFSREGTVLASGGLDNCIKLWDITKLLEEIDLEDLNISHAPNVKVNSDAYLLGSFATKSTPILCLSFTRRNLLLGAGMYHG